MKSLTFLLVFVFVLAQGSQVRKCGTEEKPAENPNTNLSACNKLPCILKRKSDVKVELKFKTEKDTNKVLNSVHANILGVPVPFVGVDGKSVCDKIFDTNGAKAKCPLKSGTEYLYKDSFKVLEVYPKISVWVDWQLRDENGKSLLCFMVPVKITS